VHREDALRLLNTMALQGSFDCAWPPCRRSRCAQDDSRKYVRWRWGIRRL